MEGSTEVSTRARSTDPNLRVVWRSVPSRTERRSWPREPGLVGQDPGNRAFRSRGLFPLEARSRPHPLPNLSQRFPDSRSASTCPCRSRADSGSQLELGNRASQDALLDRIRPSAHSVGTGFDRRRVQIPGLRGGRGAVTPPGDPDQPSYSNLNDALALRNPPSIETAAALPCDLAHRIEVEFEGIAQRIDAGSLTLAREDSGPIERGARLHPIGPFDPANVPGDLALGNSRLRVILEPDLELGWGCPEIRSIWPETIVTNWVDCRIVRR